MQDLASVLVGWVQLTTHVSMAYSYAGVAAFGRDLDCAVIWKTHHGDGHSRKFLIIGRFTDDRWPRRYAGPTGHASA